MADKKPDIKSKNTELQKKASTFVNKKISSINKKGNDFDWKSFYQEAIDKLCKDDAIDPAQLFIAINNEIIKKRLNVSSKLPTEKELENLSMGKSPGKGINNSTYDNKAKFKKSPVKLFAEALSLLEDEPNDQAEKRKSDLAALKARRGEEDSVESAETNTDASCPVPTVNYSVNKKNLVKAIRSYGYGPKYPDNPNVLFWREKSEKWHNANLDSVKDKKCHNCIFFKDNDKLTDCIDSARADMSEEEYGDTRRWEVGDFGRLGYCAKLKFVAHSTRTCNLHNTKD